MRKHPNANPFLLILVLALCGLCVYETHEKYESKEDTKHFIDGELQFMKLCDTEITRNKRLIHELYDAQADNRRLTKALDEARKE